MVTPTKGSTEAPEVIEPIKTGDARTDAQFAHQSMLDRMKEHFKHSKRVEVKVRSDADVFVQINGYSFLIAPNKKVMVPVEVATLLEQGDYI